MRANAMVPAGWQALGLEEGQLYFCDTVRGYTTFAYPDRPAGVDPPVVASSRGEGHNSLNNNRLPVSHSLCWIGGAKTSVQ